MNFNKANQWVSSSRTVSLVIGGRLGNSYVLNTIVPTYQISSLKDTKKMVAFIPFLAVIFTRALILCQ